MSYCKLEKLQNNVQPLTRRATPKASLLHSIKTTYKQNQFTSPRTRNKGRYKAPKQQQQQPVSRSLAMDTRNSGAGTASSRAYFEQQREALIGDIAESFEQVLGNINKLNRSLEAIIAVGNEFSSVEALWSQFENVMGKDEEANKQSEQQDAAKHDNDDETMQE
ncbi:DASH complex subunit Dad1 domain-containing protein [Trichoderma velutinum]